MKCSVCGAEDASPHPLRAAMIAAYYQKKNKYTDAFLYARLLTPVPDDGDEGLACAECITGETRGILMGLANDLGLAVDDYMPTWPQAHNSVRLYGKTATKRLISEITAVHPNAGKDRYKTVVTRRMKRRTSHQFVQKVLDDRRADRIKKARLSKKNEQRDGDGGTAP